MNTTYNPLLKATHAAFIELTTPEARHWYVQQLQTSAAIAHKITHQGLSLIRHWLGHEQTDVVEPVQAIAQTSPKPEQSERAAKVYFMHSSDPSEKVAAMQLKYNITPLGAEYEVKPRSPKDESTVLKPSQFQDNASLLTYYSLGGVCASR